MIPSLHPLQDLRDFLRSALPRHHVMRCGLTCCAALLLPLIADATRTDDGCFSMQAADAEPAPEPEGHAVTAAIMMHGAQSGIHEKKSVRILKQADLDKLWSTHRVVKGHTSAESLDIDFKQMMVIGLFAGDTAGGRGLRVETCRDQAKQIVIRIRRLSWQSDIAQDTSTSPWGLIVIPKSSKKVIVEIDTQTNKNQPPCWEKWAEFDALPEN